MQLWVTKMRICFSLIKRSPNWLVQLLKNASFFLFFQDCCPQRVSFLSPCLFPRDSKMAVTAQDSCPQTNIPQTREKRQEKPKTFSLMMLFVLRMRLFCTVIGPKWIPGPILNQFLAKGNGLLLSPGTRGRASSPDIMEYLYWYRKGVLLLGKVWKSAG